MRSDNQHVFIIGTGAIGKALAVFLALEGRKVTLVRGSVLHGIQETQRISIETAGGAIKAADINVTSLDLLPSLDGIIVLANKSYGNERLAALLSGKTGASPLVFLQNGLGVEQPFIDGHFPEIYRCVLFVTSQSVNNTTTRFKPVAACPVGSVKSGAGNPHHIVQQLHTSDFAFSAEDDIQPVIWRKAIINSVFNSICPLLDTDNGIFYRDATALNMARRVIAECIGIAGKQGILLAPGDVETSLLQISRSSDGQLISTLQDIQHGRPTEINTLNFEIVRIARSMQLEHTVMETRLLGELTQLKADLAQQMRP